MNNTTVRIPNYVEWLRRKYLQAILSGDRRSIFMGQLYQYSYQYQLLEWAKNALQELKFGVPNDTMENEYARHHVKLPTLNK